MAPREPGARKRLKEFLLQHVGEVLDSDELRVASGNTSEWARRVRELRNEEGMNIVTHNDKSDLRPGQYMLVDTTPSHHLPEPCQRKHGRNQVAVMEWLIKKFPKQAAALIK